MFNNFFSNKLNLSYFLNYLYIPILAIFGFSLSTYLMIKFDEEYVALFNLTYLIIIISSVIVLTGINDAIIKLSKNDSKVLIQGLYRLFKNCLSYYLILVIFFISNLNFDFFNLNQNFIIALFISPILSFNKIYYSYMLANKKLILFACMQITRVIFLFFSVLVLLSFLNKNIVFGLSFFFSEFLLLILLALLNKVKYKNIKFQNKTLKEFSYRSYLNSILTELQFKSEIFILAFFTFKADSGIFSYIIFFFEGFYEVSNVLKNILTSRYLDFYKNKKVFDKTFIRHGVANLILNSILILSSLFILIILYWVFDNQIFYNILSYFLIIAVGYLFFIFIHPSENIFIINSKPLIQSYYRTISTFFNISCGIFLIGSYGLLGASINLSISFVFAGFLFLYLKTKYIKFD